MKTPLIDKDDISRFKPYLGDYLEKEHALNLKQPFTCLNPNHNDNNPSMRFTSKYNICKCFACGACYDIFDIVGIDYGLDNFKDKINKVKEIYEGYVPVKIKEVKTNDDKIYDYTNYYKKCRLARIDDA